MLAADRDHRLDAVGRAQRARQRGRNVEAQHRQGLGEALAQGRGGARVGAVEFFGQGQQRGLGFQRRVGVVGISHLAANTGPKSLRRMVFHISDLVQLMPTSA
jgi:hypothetical protein